MSLIDNNDTILIARKQSFKIRSKDTKERSMSASLDVLQYDRGRSPPPPCNFYLNYKVFQAQFDDEVCSYLNEPANGLKIGHLLISTGAD